MGGKSLDSGAASLELPAWNRWILTPLVIAEGGVSELAHALGVAARARGMSDIAAASGITREVLYKALRPNALPRFDTINRVCAALGVKLVAQAVHS